MVIKKENVDSKVPRSGIIVYLLLELYSSLTKVPQTHVFPRLQLIKGNINFKTIPLLLHDLLQNIGLAAMNTDYWILQLRENVYCMWNYNTMLLFYIYRQDVLCSCCKRCRWLNRKLL